tara:strand:- start:1246 stop:2697 length:1452 start_codon:yes stop_codon:yes gene_type:complete
MIERYSEHKFNYYTKIILFVFFLFFFDLSVQNSLFSLLKIDNIDARFLLILIVPIFVLDLYVFSKNNGKFSLILLLIISLIVINYFYQNLLNNLPNLLTDKIKFLISIIYILIIIFYKNFILENFKTIIEYFLLIFFLLVTINASIDLYYSNTTCFFGCFSLTREIYKEASHFAFISPIILIYYLNVYSFKNISFKNKFLLLFFIVSVLKNTSTTLIATLLLTSFLVLIFNYKLIHNKKKLYVIIISFVMIIPFDKNTLQKINHFVPIPIGIFDQVSIVFDQTSIIVNNKASDIFEKLPVIESVTKVIENKPSDIFETSPKTNTETSLKLFLIPKYNPQYKNLSIEVLITNTKVAIASLKSNLIGWGLHNYKYAHDFHIKSIDNKSKVEGANWLNRTNGTNNLNKGLVEFGIFFFIPLILLIVFLIDQKIDIKLKLLIFPMLFSQIFIRGSGFFHGGFILYLIILLLIYIDKYNKIPKKTIHA